MPKNVRRIRWSAKNVPWGMRFNERTGVFYGTPIDLGEYIVPVTVETDYGKVTENVIIKVEQPQDNGANQ